MPFEYVAGWDPELVCLAHARNLVTVRWVLACSLLTVPSELHIKCILYDVRPTSAGPNNVFQLCFLQFCFVCGVSFVCLFVMHVDIQRHHCEESVI